MNVLILTNPDHKEFIHSVLNSMNVSMHIFGIFSKTPPDFSSYDIGISFMYQHKVPAKEVNSHTWFNFHPAPLPEYKGRNLCYHAIMNGETEFGATLHYMDENFDTGDIIEVMRFIIPEWWTAEQLSDATIMASQDLFKVYFPFIISGKEFERLPNEGGAYYTKGGIVDAYTPSSAIDNWVRAVTYKEFYPKLIIGGKTYKIVRDE